MRWNNQNKFIWASALVLSLAGLFASACSSGFGSGVSSGSGGLPPGSGSLNPSCSPTAQFPAPASSNVMSVTVNAAQGGSGNCSLSTNYPNKPCVSVTICTPGCDQQCQTINDLLLDTGSVGLRVFASVLTIPLGQQVSGTSAVAECVTFGDGSTTWGPVELADMYLAGEPIIKNVPIQVINSSYSSPPAACSASQGTPATSPEQSGFNGILGLGLFKQDCGSNCSQSNNGLYYACSVSGGCVGIAAANSLQLQNPVAMLPTDNNGVVLVLPYVDPAGGGTTTVTGSLYLGIGTQSNNTPGSVTTLRADSTGLFNTTFNSTTIPGFIDTGSNGYAFPTPAGLDDCSASQYNGSSGFNGGGKYYFCPASLQSLSATNLDTSGSPSKVTSFSVDNTYNLFFVNNGGNNLVFPALGFPVPGLLSGSFDWGLPFHFGKTVYVGIQGTSSTLGAGPYWAY